LPTRADCRSQRPLNDPCAEPFYRADVFQQASASYFTSLAIACPEHCAYFGNLARPALLCYGQLGFWPIFSSGFGFFSPARHFPFVASGRGGKHSAYPTAFPANPSNPALNPTCA
jgi:hypothetical protein